MTTRQWEEQIYARVHDSRTEAERLEEVAAITITWREYTALLQEAVEGKALAASLGEDEVRLERIPENEWALEMLGEMRVRAYVEKWLDKEC